MELQPDLPGRALEGTAPPVGARRLRRIVDAERRPDTDRSAPGSVRCRPSTSPTGRAVPVGLPRRALPARGGRLPAVRGPRAGAWCRRPCCATTPRSGPVRSSCSSSPTTSSTTSPSSRTGAARTSCRSSAPSTWWPTTPTARAATSCTRSDGRLWGIDHGLCFHVQHKLRTVIWDFAGEERARPHRGRPRASSAPPGCPPRFDGLLSEAEADAVLERAARSGRCRGLPRADGRASALPLATGLTADHASARRSGHGRPAARTGGRSGGTGGGRAAGPTPVGGAPGAVSAGRSPPRPGASCTCSRSWMSADHGGGQAGAAGRASDGCRPGCGR